MKCLIFSILDNGTFFSEIVKNAYDITFRLKPLQGQGT